ncbi:GMC family oxidoreductase [Streptomyces sp. SID2563]|uniref:GMC oxidoreductase n=1 Tax=Streptomyces sp. SID2563 TaxID=2690255 RepID=UPI001368C7A7|nr:GMC family oxidoreductase [Streptomyces sp. SID2563]
MISTIDPQQPALEADVVVVGAGPAGMAVASGLIEAGRHVLVLDSGAFRPAPDPDLGGGRIEGGNPYYNLAACRPRGLGGSTTLWGGWIEPLDPIDFEDRPEVTGASGWCLDHAELAPYYTEALAFCGVPDKVDLRSWKRQDEARAAGSPLESRCFPALGAVQLGHRHAGMFTTGRADLLLDATVTRIVTSPDGSSVDHLVVASPKGECRVTGGSFVLAAGGFETPRLLLASANGQWPEGLGNGHDIVGRYFMEHPHVDILRFRGNAADFDLGFFAGEPAGTSRDGQPMSTTGALMLSDDACRAAGVGRAQLFLEEVGAHTQHRIAVEHRDRPVHLKQSVPATSDELALVAVTEQIPHRDSRVVLGEDRDRYGVPKPVVHWELTDTDHRTVDVAAAAARDLLHTLGATEARIRPNAWSLDTVGGPHHLGTTRMADSPSEGVVNSDSRVHDVTNLYIAGGSTFPTGGYAPPTLTVVALSLRLAHHLTT